MYVVGFSRCLYSGLSLGDSTGSSSASPRRFNTRRRLIRVEPISQGTLDTLLVHPREVFKAAIAASAAAIIIVHNHPSGDPTPSEADIKVTRDLIRAGQLLKIDLLDHIILGRACPERPKEYASLRELGFFYP